MEMRDTFAGLAGTRVMSSRYHGACWNPAAVVPVDKDQEPFFISRPVPEDVPNKTKTILDLCRELIDKTREQAEMIEKMGAEITRLNARVIDMENRQRIPAATRIITTDSTGITTGESMTGQIPELLWASGSSISGSSDNPNTFTVTPTYPYDNPRGR